MLEAVALVVTLSLASRSMVETQANESEHSQSRVPQSLMDWMVLGGGGLAGAAMVSVPKAIERPMRVVESFILSSRGFDRSESGVWKAKGRTARMSFYTSAHSMLSQRIPQKSAVYSQ